MRRMSRSSHLVIALAGLSAGPCVFGQDSVALTPGGNDALSSYDATVQRVRYAVDLAPATTSWNNGLLIGPVLKASRDVDPTFKTQILGSLAISPNLATSLAFPSKSFASWASAGAGVNPTNNTGPGTVSAAAFRSQFGLALSDFSLLPSSVVGATVGRVSGQFNRLFVERVIAASSRAAGAGADTSTVSLGGVDAAGNVAIRADNFNTSAGTATRILGDNILRVDLTTRNAAVNTLRSSGGVNTSDDTGATTYVISNETTPTNTPTILNPSGSSPFALAYDFAGQLRSGSSTAGVITTTAHSAGLGLAGHRGNPSYSPITLAGGSSGTVASIAMPTGGSNANRLLVFGVAPAGGPGTAPTLVPGTQNAYALPQPLTAGAFTANSGGQAAFRQYQSQTPWRGGNGQVAVGQNAAAKLMLAATASDPGAGDFIAVATVSTPGTASWTVAAYPGKAVLDGPGNTIGTITTPAASTSAPAMDKLGNVYFVATWKPTLTPQEVGVFKAVNAAGGYKLELLLRQGQTINGVNSTRPYTVSQIALNDSDSIASGTMFSQSVIQQQDPASTTTDPTKIRAFGGLVVSTVITYDNNGTPEAYDAVLYVGPGQGTDCRADFNGDTFVTVQDIFDFLAAWFAHLASADFNGDASVTVQDIFEFLAAWFAHC